MVLCPPKIWHRSAHSPLRITVRFGAPNSNFKFISSASSPSPCSGPRQNTLCSKKLHHFISAIHLSKRVTLKWLLVHITSINLEQNDIKIVSLSWSTSLQCFVKRCGTWYLPHSQVHNERYVPIIMARCIAHARNGHIFTSGLKSDVTIVVFDLISLKTRKFRRFAYI